MSPLLERALARRGPIRAADTTAMRILDGAGDGVDGVEIEDFAGRWLVQTREAGFPAWLRGVEGPRSVYWKKLGGQKETPEHVEGDLVNAPFEARENGMRLWIDFAAGYSQGVFLDQRDNRAELRRRARGLRVLNCFAYTCAFGVAAALGGAGETVNIDLSRHYLEWGRRNYDLNSVKGDFIYGDALNWMERLGRKGRRFDIVVLDPPTFSRDRVGRVFTIQTGLPGLIAAAAKLIDATGSIFCSSNQRNLAPADFRRLITSGLEAPARWNIRACPMPPDFPAPGYLKACWLERQE